MPTMDESRLEGSVRAPEFPESLDWLNTDRRLSLRDFRGKIVLLDFWTFCCINCMHVIPDLKKLEAKYPNELVVIGVHSAKFFNEKDTESIRQAILRYGIKHPVLNDKDMEVWGQYSVSAWPTLVLINPNGRIIGMHSGEQIFDLLDNVISQAISYFDRKGELKRRPLNLKLEAAKQPDTLLSFPGKVRADATKNLLYISDSNHNRILITDPEGKVLDTIGSGGEGRKDGSFEAAEFNHPQGVFADGDTLYIADTENHLVRAADLKKHEVKTILSALNSPWDLLVHQGKLYIAMAGPHQIYVADLKTLETEPYAGSGREARIDGPLRIAALAQPSGITTDGRRLYFADSEVSSIRAADLDPSGKVETLIGEDLFEFGDIDGDRSKARLQHPLGVEFSEGVLYVADTYNSKIKVIDPAKKISVTYAGSGTHGAKNGNLREAEFFEPGGLTVLGGRIYVADTNNHQIRVLDRKSKQVSTLTLSGLAQTKKPAASPFKARAVDLPPQILKEGRGSVRLSFNLPAHYKFTENAPFHIDWKSEGAAVQFRGPSDHWDTEHISFPVEIPVEAKSGKGALIFEAVIYFCRENSSVCLFDHVKVRVPVEVKKEGPSEIQIQLDLLAKI